MVFAMTGKHALNKRGAGVGAGRARAALTTFAAAAALMVATPGQAQAQDFGSANLSSSIGSSVDQQLAQLDRQTRDGAWNLRQSLHAQINAVLPGDAGLGLRNAVDAAVNAFFPGLIAQRTAPAPAPAPAPVAAPAPQNFDRGSCPVQARACVDLAGGRAWLQRGGQVTYGAVPMSAGAPGWETPKGTHWVQRKVKDEVSYIFNMAPMPYSTYFTNTGVAFHEGDINLLSHGCIHLRHQDAVTFFNDLQVGDMVYVY